MQTPHDPKRSETEPDPLAPPAASVSSEYAASIDRERRARDDQFQKDWTPGTTLGAFDSPSRVSK